MAKTSSRPTSLNDDSEVLLRFGSGRWRNNNRLSGIRFKVCLCGKFDVGKTSLFLRLQGQEFVDKKPICQTTTYEFCDEDDKTIEYSIWDTNGFEERNALSLGDHYRNAHCIILVYDVSDFESLQYLDYELANIEKFHYSPDAKYILVQNKIDMKQSKFISYEVQKEFISNSRLQTKVDSFCRTSAKLNEGVSELFGRDLKEILAMPVSLPDSIGEIPTSEGSVSAFDQFITKSSLKKEKKKKMKQCKTM